jgi:hypothetical protein
VFASVAKVEFQTRSDNAGNVRTNERLRRIHAAIVPWKSKSITYSECAFVALVIQRGKRMRPILYHIFPHNHTKGKILYKKIIEHKMCVLISSTYLV